MKVRVFMEKQNGAREIKLQAPNGRGLLCQKPGKHILRCFSMGDLQKKEVE
ncbi:hypothetical protein ACFL0Q_04955 [Thermodesulfobacteriota bacterium]